MTKVTAAHPAAKAARAAFPEYRGRKFTVETATSVELYDTAWDGGTRNEYRAVAIDGRTAQVSDHHTHPMLLPQTTVELTRQTALVKRSHFCGRDMGLTIYVHPGVLLNSGS
jgi:hypothetical protein